MSSTASHVKYTTSEDELMSQTVINAVSEVIGCDPIELDPVYEYIDPDALDAVFSSPSSIGENQDDIYLEFAYMTYRVTVTTDHVHVYSQDEE
ncbi:HalOD1 output domain-containing protein [Natrinema salinisoli]|uniref:HalOD1 output domain-containing protein n=1 Tax=Natrinema salinisoli TaxID=2878535 RepID=UPI001CF03A19|nr:HalOD1 output domain-containing protein [Natrinema salinisoli]